MYVVSEVTLFSLVSLPFETNLAAAIFWPQLRTGQWDRELAYGLLMTRYLTPGLLGLVYVAMLGGIISVVGDNLNFGSQVLLNDIYRRHLVKCASERHYLLAGRLAIFVVLGLSLLVVYRVRFVFDVAVFMVGLSAAEMSANWAQWWWWRFNGWARVAASFGGGACYLTIALLWPTWAWWNRMFLSIGISTLLWIVVTLVTTPERHELLLTFYRRAHPLGRWAPIAQLAGEPRSTTKPRFPIAAGLALAFAGALAVMAYITGISQFYVGRYNTGLLLFSILVLAGALFFLGFPRYIDALLSPEEKQQAAESGTSAGAFGLHRVFSVVCFGASAVLGFQTAFLRGGPTSLTLCLVAVCGGLLLLHYGRTKGIKQSGV